MNTHEELNDEYADFAVKWNNPANRYQNEVICIEAEISVDHAYFNFNIMLKDIQNKLLDAIRIKPSTFKPVILIQDDLWTVQPSFKPPVIKDFS